MSAQFHDPAKISVVICTRNRGGGAANSVKSVLDNNFPALDLVVVDQSDDDNTQLSLAQFDSLRDFHYIRSSSVGLSAARNIGLEAACGDIVLMTDDDCLVPNSWVQEMSSAVEGSDFVGLVFGNVHAPVTEEGYSTPISIQTESFTVHGLRTWRAADGVNIGIGASMAMRRSVVLSIGGFDSMLGAGARFHSAEDTDMSVRMLLRGYKVVRLSGASVEHLGARSYLEGRRLIRESMYGVGACYGKLLRCRHYWLLIQVWRIYWSMLIRPTGEALVRLRRPPIWGRLQYLHKGLLAGLRTPVDLDNEVFAELPD